MEFMVILILFTAIAWVRPSHVGGRSLRSAMRIGLGAGFVATGVSHLLFPEMFFAYFPAWVPFQLAIILGSGVLEIAGGLSLISGRFQREAGIASAVLLVLIFPGNLHAAIAGTEPGFPGAFDDAWYAWVRLPLQAVLIWWALFSTGVIQWRRSDLSAATPRAGIGQPGSA